MVVRIIAGLIIVSIVLYAIRAVVLLHNSNQLFAQSAHFDRDYFVGSSTDPLLLYIAMGDSTAVGTGADAKEGGYVYAIAQKLAAQKRSVHVINLGVSGARTADVVQNQLSKLSTERPQVISLSIGANDSTHFTKTDQFQRSTDTVIQTLAQSGAEKILFAGSPDMYKTPALPKLLSYFMGQHGKTQNDYVQQMITGSNIQYVDIFNDAKLDYTKDPALYASDLFHPSAKGYAIWAAVFLSQL
jgi:acyl-CoA thioesterase-1